MVKWTISVLAGAYLAIAAPAVAATYDLMITDAAGTNTVTAVLEGESIDGPRSPVPTTAEFSDIRDVHWNGIPVNGAFSFMQNVFQDGPATNISMFAYVGGIDLTPFEPHYPEIVQNFRDTGNSAYFSIFIYLQESDAYRVTAEITNFDDYAPLVTGGNANSDSGFPPTWDGPIDLHSITERLPDPSAVPLPAGAALLLGGLGILGLTRRRRG